MECNGCTFSCACALVYSVKISSIWWYVCNVSGAGWWSVFSGCWRVKWPRDVGVGLAEDWPRSANHRRQGANIHTIHLCFTSFVFTEKVVIVYIVNADSQ